MAWSYATAERMGIRSRMSEFAHLAKATGSTAERDANDLADYSKWVRSVYAEHVGAPLADGDILEIGPGQKLGMMRCLGTDNRVIGIDTDVIPQSAADYLRLVRQNAPLRAAKTLGRKALGIDRRFVSALYTALGADRTTGRLDVRTMSATDLQLDDDSFDLVHSFSVFEHIDDPAAALREIERVVRPGGMAYISVHIFTSHCGIHDPRMLGEPIPQPPLWPHLRPAHIDSAHRSCYLNEVTLDEWCELFTSTLPGVELIRFKHRPLVEPLAELRAAGELADYSDDDLLTLNLVAVWRNGDASSSPPVTDDWVD